MSFTGNEANQNLHKNSKIRVLKLNEKDVHDSKTIAEHIEHKKQLEFEEGVYNNPKSLPTLTLDKDPLVEQKELIERRSKIFGVIRSILYYLLLTVLILLALLAVLVLPPLLSIKSSINTIQKQGNEMQADLASKQFTAIPGKVDIIRIELQDIRAKLNKFDFLQKAPIFNKYYPNLETTKEILDNTDLLLTKAQPKIQVFVDNLQEAVDVRNTQEASEVTTQEQSASENDSAPVEQTNAELCAVQLKDNPDLQKLGVNSQELAEERKEENSGSTAKVRDIISVLPEGVDVYNEVEPEVLILLRSINKLDPSLFPAFTPRDYIAKINNILALTKDTEANFPKYSDLIQTFVSKLPDLIGSKKPVTYLVIFQNEKEMRASGGLLTAYGLVTLDKGKVVGEIKTHDMWYVQYDIWDYVYGGMGLYNSYGQLTLMENGCGASELRAQDSGVSPDAKVSTELFLQYYDTLHEYLPDVYTNYDHVIMLNTFFASDMVSLIEPLILDDCSVVTSENLAKFIFANRDGEDGRKTNIGRVAKAAENEITAVSSSKLDKAVEIVTKTIIAKNIAFYSKETAMQSYFTKMGMTGEMVYNYSGDYFQMSEAQVCGLKANFYLKDVVTQHISVNENGHVSKDVQTIWSNEQIHLDSEDDIISSSGRFPYRAWIRYITPSGTEFTKSDGYAQSGWLYYPQTYYDAEMDKDVSDNVIWFNHLRVFETDPIPSLDLNISYEVPDKYGYTAADGYKMLVEKHPGKKDEKYVVAFHYLGQVYTKDFVLDRNKVVTFKAGEITVTDYPSPLDDYLWLFTKIKAASE